MREIFLPCISIYQEKIIFLKSHRLPAMSHCPELGHVTTSKSITNILEWVYVDGFTPVMTLTLGTGPPPLSILLWLCEYWVSFRKKEVWYSYRIKAVWCTKVHRCTIRGLLKSIPKEQNERELLPVGRTLSHAPDCSFCLKERWQAVCSYGDSWAVGYGLASGQGLGTNQVRTLVTGLSGEWDMWMGLSEWAQNMNTLVPIRMLNKGQLMKKRLSMIMRQQNMSAQPANTRN